MKSKVSTKIISMILAMVMMITTFSACLVASATSLSPNYSHAPKTPSGYTVMDNAKYSTASYSTMAMDFLDDSLKQQNFKYSLGILGTLDATSFDNLMASLKNFRGYYSMLGDVNSLNLSSIYNLSRSGSGDEQCVKTLVNFVKDSNTLSFVDKFLKNNVNFGIADSFVPDMSALIDFDANIDSALTGALPAGSTLSYTTATTLDANFLSFANAWIPVWLNGLDDNYTTFGTNPAGTNYNLGTGFSIASTDTIDQVIDKALKIGMNYVLISMPEWTKNFKDSQGNLMIPVNQITFAPYNFTSASFYSQLNGLIDYIAAELEPNATITGTTWQERLASLIGAVINDRNIVKVSVNVNAFMESGETTPDLMDYIEAICKALFTQFAPQIAIPDGSTLKDMLGIALKEFVANYYPDANVADTDGTAGLGYKDYLYYICENVFPQLLDTSEIDISTATNFDGVVRICMNKAISYVNGFFPNILTAPTNTNPDLFDYIESFLTPYIPSSLMPRDQNGTALDLGDTLRTDVDGILNGTYNFNLSAYGNVRTNSTIPTAMSDVLTLVKNVVNKIAAGSNPDTNAAIPATVTTFDALLGGDNSNISRVVRKLISNISVSAVGTDGDFVASVLPIVCSIMGYTGDQANNGGSVESPNTITLSSSKALPTGDSVQKLKIKNNSTGVPAYHSDTTPATTDSAYLMKITGLTCSDSSITFTNPTDTALRPNECVLINLGGSATTDNSVVSFTVTYQMMDESGNYMSSEQSTSYTYVTTATASSSSLSFGGQKQGMVESVTPNGAYISTGDLRKIEFTITREGGHLFVGWNKDAYVYPQITSQSVPTGASNLSMANYVYFKPLSKFNADNVSQKTYLSGKLKVGEYSLTMRFNIKTFDPGADPETATPKANENSNSETLTFKVYDDCGLGNLVNQIKSKYINPSEYNSTTDGAAAYTTFYNAFTAALARVSSPVTSGTPADITASFQTAYNNLNTAYANLKQYRQLSRTALDTALETAKSKDIVDYSLKSFVKYIFAYLPASSTNSETSQHYLTEYARVLNRSFTNTLKQRASSKTQLDNAITAASALSQSDYTADSWSAFSTALTAAQNVSTNFNSATTLQSAANSARANLLSAINRLVHV